LADSRFSALAAAINLLPAPFAGAKAPSPVLALTPASIKRALTPANPDREKSTLKGDHNGYINN
jgi:hypothetical protein